MGTPIIESVRVTLDGNAATIRYSVDWNGGQRGSCGLLLDDQPVASFDCATAVVPGLEPGTQHAGRVLAQSAAGVTAERSVTFTVPEQLVPIPADVTADATGPTSAAVAFGVDWRGLDPGTCAVRLDGREPVTGPCDRIELNGLEPGADYSGTLVLTSAGGVTGETPFTVSTPPGVGASPSATQLEASTGMVVVRQTVELTARVSGAFPGGPAATGSVTFTDGGVVLGSAPLDAAGVASLSVGLPRSGDRAIVATYGGDAAYSESSSDATQVQVFRASVALSVTADRDPVPTASDLVITARMTPDTPTGSVPGGTVTFTEAAVVLAADVPVDDGSATWRGRLSPGQHEITAAYSGDELHAPRVNSATITVALRPGVKLWAWGENQFGTVGDGTTTPHLDPNQKATPTPVAGTWTEVSVGGDGHVSAIGTDSSLWGWGFGGFGGIGDGTQDSHATAVRIGTGNDWRTVSAGIGHSAAIRDDGSLWAWGLNNYGQVGSGPAFTTSPVQLGIGQQWVAVHAAFGATFAVRDDGTLWATGFNEFGTLGDGTTVNRSVLTRVGSRTDWDTATLSGTSTIVAVFADGSLWTWGLNNRGQVGDGTTVNRTEPTRLGTASWRAADASTHGLAVRDDGTLWSWGANGSGELGDGTTADRLTPVQVGSVSNWTSVATGNASSHALRADGTLWGWGWSSYGELGDGSFTNGSPDPTPVTSPIRVGLTRRWDVVDSNGSQNTIAGSSAELPPVTVLVTTERDPVYTEVDTAVAVTVVGATSAVPTGTVDLFDGGVSVGSAMLNAGRATFTRRWSTPGPRTFRAVYQGDARNQPGEGSSQLRVLIRPSVTTITATAPPNYRHDPLTITATVAPGAVDSTIPGLGTTFGSVAFRDNGVLIGTLPLSGGRASFNVDDPTVGTHVYSATFGGNTTWASSGAQLSRTVVVGPNLWAWGETGTGVLGAIGTGLVDPRRMASPNDWVAVNVSGHHAAGLRSDGSLWTWGHQPAGENGHGTLALEPQPLRVGSDNDWWQVSLGGYYTLALKRDGSLWAWGDNHYGQFGNGTTTGSPVPVRVGTAVWKHISAGFYTASGVTADGRLWSWGESGGFVPDCGLPCHDDPTSARTLGTRASLGSGSHLDVDEFPNTLSPVNVIPGQRFRSVERSGEPYWGHAAAQALDGTLWEWSWGQTSIVSKRYCWFQGETPAQVTDVTSWVDYSVNWLETYAINSSGQLFRWGGRGERESSVCRPSPWSSERWREVDVSSLLWHGIREDGTLWVGNSRDMRQVGNRRWWTTLGQTSSGEPESFGATPWSGGHGFFAIEDPTS
ncbi:MAG: Ig-like domain repeat protein [Microthrixaceae bacterium]|nr:Ig-like domain repeat protein [Microthrixaceae bacterium]